MSKRPLIVVVDDDESVRESLPDLLRELGFEPAAFSSADEFLGSDLVEQANCLILDVARTRRAGTATGTVSSAAGLTNRFHHRSSR